MAQLAALADAVHRLRHEQGRAVQAAAARRAADELRLDTMRRRAANYANRPPAAAAG